MMRLSGCFGVKQDRFKLKLDGVLSTKKIDFFSRFFMESLLDCYFLIGVFSISIS